MGINMAWLDYFRRSNPGTASVAKNRLSIIVAREGRARGQLNYLPQLRQELLQVLAKYEKIDLDQVTVNVESQAGCDMLELNVVLPTAGDVRRVSETVARHTPFFSEAARIVRSSVESVR
jgi:cell division topological specificity factor